jgi:hypothetical protein
MNKNKLLVVGLAVAIALSLALSGLALARSSNDEGVGVMVGGIDVPGSGKFTTVQVLSGQQQVGLWVNGTGEVTAKPDIAVVTLGVQIEAKTVAAAQQQASQAMSAVMVALTTMGIADKDVKTTSFSIQPVWNYDVGIYSSNQRILEGYQVYNMVSVTIRDVAKAGAIIDVVAEAGGDLTRVENIYFTVDKPEMLYDQARVLAVKDAMDKAQQIASLAGLSLGKPIYISESGGYIPTPMDKMAEAVSSTPISAGELDISVSVQIVYAIE